ncbi:MAG: anthranilate phosphoribosyltransferase [Chloroflexota bacterium]|nr:anthranilate phosphoribosyltransferase [Chloroflexota bacterium]
MDAREAVMAVAAGGTLTRAEAESAMASVMAGEATAAQLGALLAALAVRGETVDEIAGFAAGLRAAAVRVDIPAGAIDTCGTGGDRSHSFNISTVSAIVAAAAGARVAKHGNRAASSACGSADVLEALGVKIDLGAASVATCIDEVGVGFMFAPRFHPAMRHAGPVRREIGIRTIFNVLGPLANPAGVRRQLLGVPSTTLGERMVQVLRELGAERGLVVHSADGLDEISPSGPTRTWELCPDGTIKEGELTPEGLGLEQAPRESVRGGDSDTNARIARAVLSGSDRGGPRTAVLLNAGAACYVAGLAPDPRAGVALAAAAIDSGNASATLDRWVARSMALS